jgi:HSP20 family protein
MLETLQHFGKELGRDLARGWESLTEGWRELLSRSSNALTRFTGKSEKDAGGNDIAARDAPHWSLLAGDLMDTGSEFVVRIELPGVAREDCEIVIDGNTLVVRGEKRADITDVSGGYYLRQCAYGLFERSIPLPRNVLADRAEAQFRNGVLVVKLPKGAEDKPRQIRIQ